ncbi:TetR/AcrR family transcriptional regulator [Roseibacterium sp. SDUM158017]|uniref:TetR/AcrR family transcriptional regulator n=1 Tax=Roseicyclus salinarum TaxID=3036773 RepID=UPI0024159614|nr:TetR/AcrR family transcriptional regulator [Roseibacterium sp. SDUM158017]MDG4647334.1 TetR/AcrR family transcriptional regulator [Roseibacterium sp. SDUM158017]
MPRRDDTGAGAPPRTRDPERTEAGILQAAVREFAQHGYHGARIVRIAKAARCNTRMIYHYFGGKEPLYVAVIDSVYASIRNREAALNLSEDTPLESMRRLVEFTFDYFHENQAFLNITRNENILGGKFIRRSRMIRSMSQPLTESIGRILDRGVEAGLFRHRPDPLQLYLSIVALSAHHLNNAHTLSATFGEDFSDPAWLGERRRHAVTMILRDLGVADA